MTAPSPDPDLQWWQRPVPRPASVTWAGGILWALAGLALVGTCAVGLLASASRTQVSARAGVGWIVAIFGAIGIVDGLLGYHVLRGRQWARIAAIVLGCLNIALGGVALLRGTATACVSIVLQVAIIGLLMTTAAGAYFRNPA